MIEMLGKLDPVCALVYQTFKTFITEALPPPKKKVQNYKK